MNNKNWKWWTLVFFLFVNVLVQIVGGIFTASSVSTWYYTLEKASWHPPSWVFGPVWTFLYLAIAIAGWLVCLKPSSKRKKTVIRIYWVQLAVNALWSYFFFYLKSPLLGLFDILILLPLIGWAIYEFWHLSRFSSFIFVIYFFWTAYAATLNGAIWILNRG